SFRFAPCLSPISQVFQRLLVLICSFSLNHDRVREIVKILMGQHTRGCAIAFVALLCTGCATFRSYDKELRGTINAVSSGNVDGAIQVLQSNNKSEKKDLLYYF